jgi:integrative and conjugative element protein (TIGR02256 family)
LNDRQELVFTDAAIATLQAARQHRTSDREAGGQLFGTISSDRVVVEHATGVRSGDHRSRMAFFPNRSAERREIVEQHHAGRVYLGDWHTHPEAVPRPSETDVASVAEIARKSRHLAGPVVLAVVGTAELPAGIHVLVHDGRTSTTLSVRGEAAIGDQ